MRVHDTHSTGRAWVFPGVLDVDYEICPFATVREWQRSASTAGEGEDVYAYAELGRLCMTTVDPAFPDKVRWGDFLVAEHNMGFGHDHDHASASIRGAGVAAVLCESAAPYFLRNSFEHGLPVLEVPGVFAGTTTGDELTVDLHAGTVTNARSGTEFTFDPLPDFLLDMIRAGGIYPLLRTQLRR